MSLFRKKEKTIDKAAWAEAVFEKPVKNPEALSDKELHAMTDLMLYQDYRIIMESVQIIRNTKNPDTRQGRIDLCRKHYSQLMKLEPYADDKQRAVILQCEQVLKGIVI